ncbi:WcbI family polysaccharide biosynthesis putative acetyltransferase [Nocardioides sp. Soil805]|uniref:WcbI family polysaccharide biosynthesis putative acetyltransferase n=1 Tax=Nocardioides sp. Soil805 TaxID=1736416 RepID=UPI001EEE4C0C|nr:WcbI family polysaccharide biosynthesis putative acetyltransferase [Nocardioides sp. Soil805]
MWGNCQASAVRRLLKASPGFAGRFDVAWLPGVHEVSADQLPVVRRIVEGADVAIVQPVRDGYRGLAVGTEEILAHNAKEPTVLRYPAIYYTGLHPYLVYVHATGELGTPMPVTGGYHDLRFISVASSGAMGREAESRLLSLVGDEEALRRNAQESLSELARRELSLDVRVSHRIDALGVEAVWTVNHPSNALLSEVATQVSGHLGLEGTPAPGMQELLQSVVSPVHADVRAALKRPVDGSNEWKVDGTAHHDLSVMHAHLAHYRDNPRVLQVAQDEHAEKLGRFGLIN